MNQDLIDDLKQFIAATVSQAAADMVTKGDIADLQGNIARIEQKVDDGFAGVGEAIEQIHEHTAEREAVVDRRLTRLERALPG